MSGDRRAETGAALLVVLGATAALAVPTALLLFGAGIAYEIEAYSGEVAQARLLARTVRAQVVRATGNGDLAPPVPHAPIVIRNGVREGAGDTVAVAVFPAPPGITDWPPVTDLPPAGPVPGFGIGAEAALTVVVGPRGEARGLDGPVGADPEGSLVDLEVRAWFRRAVVVVAWRLRVTETGLESLD